MACTGIEFCKLAIVDTKDRARDLVAELEKRFPDLDTPITVNVNGCPNACARTQVADIGLKGMLVARRRRQPGRGLPGPPRRRLGLQTPSARSCAPQGHQRGSRRLRHDVVKPTCATAPRARLRRLGVAPTRSCCAARRRWRTEARADRSTAPTAGRGPVRPTRSEGRPRAWECRSCLRRVQGHACSAARRLEWSCRAGRHADDHPHDARCPRRARLAHRGPQHRRAQGHRLPGRRRARARARPRTSSSGRSRPSADGSA